jgi:hypothetical protein
MATTEAGMQGGVPAVAVKPVDARLPACAKPVDGGACTRKAGHYGACGVAQ